MGYNIDYLEKKANELRKDTLDMCIKARTGHVTSSLSCAEILTSLYHGGILNQDPKNPNYEDRDRFILSKGQASPVLYATLADLGYFPKEWLGTFAQKDAPFGVHLQKSVPGIEVTTGSLGHGLGIGAGIALAAKKDKKNYSTIVLLGDGELYEGSNWEAAMFASHNKLNNLIAIVDRNWLCVTDYTEDLIKLNSLTDKWESFGWRSKSVNGHSVEEILGAFEGYKAHKSDQPYVIIADTIKGKGVSFLESTTGWHGLAPSGEQAEKAVYDLDQLLKVHKK